MITTMTHDLARIPTSLETAHTRCEEWAKWVRVTHRPFGIQPMFRHYRAPGRWDVETVVPAAVNTLQALEIERLVATLPERLRTVLRWAYVWPGLHANAVCRELGCNRDGLAALRDEALSRVLVGLEKKEFPSRFVHNDSTRLVSPPIAA